MLYPLGELGWRRGNQPRHARRLVDLKSYVHVTLSGSHRRLKYPPSFQSDLAVRFTLQSTLSRSSLFLSCCCFFFMSTKLKGTPYLFSALQAVYIAPLKALVRERMDDWKVRFEQKLGRR